MCKESHTTDGQRPSDRVAEPFCSATPITTALNDVLDGSLKLIADSNVPTDVRDAAIQATKQIDFGV